MDNIKIRSSKQSNIGNQDCYFDGWDQFKDYVIFELKAK